MKLSFAILTHNPDLSILEQVLQALLAQAGEASDREILLIDNLSSNGTALQELLSKLGEPVRYVAEERLGLTAARMRAVREAHGELIVFVDDDNILDEKFASEAIRFAEEHREVAIFGGKILPKYESEPPKWIEKFHTQLALHDFGEKVLIAEPWTDSKKEYPHFSPIGAGMVLRKDFAIKLPDDFEKDFAAFSDRKGKELSSGGDCIINMLALSQGWNIAYVPALKLQHLIPGTRTSLSYLSRACYGISRSWVNILHKFGICPWEPIESPTTALMKIKLFFQKGAFFSQQRFLNWRSFCGSIDGRRDISKKTFSLNPGRAAYILFYRPRSFFINLVQKPPWQRIKNRRSENIMRDVASSLRVPPGAIDQEKLRLELHLLTGSAFWHQSAFFCYSFIRESRNEHLHPVFYDDGSLSDLQITMLHEVFPSCTLVMRKEIEDRLDNSLPRERFPSLRARRDIYPHLGKLTDIHAGLQGWKLVCDSDMLILRTPKELLDWLKEPKQAICLEDHVQSYGYSEELLRSLSKGSELPEKVNVGICGLQSESIDWEFLEHCCSRMLKTEGPKYTQEQAFVALLLAKQPYLMLPRSDYIVYPSDEQIQNSEGTLQHYVDSSKSMYFARAWKGVYS